MNWFIDVIQKEARHRRFRVNDKVRFFTRGRKNNKVVLTPEFNKGTVVDYNGEMRRYIVRNDSEEQFEVHPRNIIPDSVFRSQDVVPTATDNVEMTEQFPR